MATEVPTYETHEEWAKALADAVDMLLNDTSQGRATATLKAYRAWAAAPD
jgi:hypothetical protein